MKVQHLIMDGKFEPLRANLPSMGITLNAASNDEHVGDIKQYIRTIKECTRCIYTTLPFQCMPACLIVEIIYASIFWLNSFPTHSGISDSISPRSIITGQRIDYLKHCHLEFGTYIEVHEEHDNLMASCTTGASAL